MPRWILIITLVAAALFGTASPLAKKAFNLGLHPVGYVIVYIIGLSLGGLIMYLRDPVLMSHGKSIFPGLSWFPALTAGLMCGAAFFLMTTALSQPEAKAAVIMVLIAMNPILTEIVCLSPFLNEGVDIKLKLFIPCSLGALICVAGVILSMTQKTQ